VGRRWRTALVTGASSGIGRQIALQVARRGADVVLVARREAALEELAREVRAGTGRIAEVLVADLTGSADLARVEARVGDPDRLVDLVVNNAGLGGAGAFQELDLDREEAEVRLNCLAVLRLSHAALSAMLPRGRGGLLNVSSLAGFQALPTSATYGASKAFVTSLTEALHEEARGTGVHVTALCPGFVRTGFHRASDIGEDGRGRDLPAAVFMDAGAVAQAGLDAVTRNRTLCVPGAGYRTLAGLSALLPRAALRRLVGELAART